MATDKALLKSLFDELSDFSFTDQLDRHAREGVSDAIYNEVDHIRDCIGHLNIIAGGHILQNTNTEH